MRILLAGGGTGGHLYPGLAIARALRRSDPSAEPFFIGAARGIERDVLPATEFPFELLDLHPLYRSRPWENWKTVRGATGAWRRLGALIARDRPGVVVGTGGYAAGLALAAAFAHRIPIALQEQNSHPGLTTRFFARYAREVYLGFPEAEHAMPHRGATFVDSGNPIEPPPEPRPSRAEARREWGFPEGSRVLLVFGGSQGARAINDVVGAWIERGVPNDLCVVWGTGKAHFAAYGRYEGERVRVRPYLAPITKAYAAADLAVARAGAMGTAELCAWGIPAVLVPLPTAAADHQTANARALERAGAAIAVAQRELTVETLDRVVRKLTDHAAGLNDLAAAALRRARPDAAARIAERILALVRQGGPG